MVASIDSPASKAVLDRYQSSLGIDLTADAQKAIKDNINQFVIKYKLLVTKLATLEIVAPDNWYIILFITALSTSFPIWAKRQRSVIYTDGNKITLDKLIVDITDESRSITSGEALYTGKN